MPTPHWSYLILQVADTTKGVMQSQPYSWIGYVLTFISGGLMGAFVNRFFFIRDRAIKKLTLIIEEEEIRSILPVMVYNKNYQNLIYKKFTLNNSTKNDFEELDIVFEFDKDSEIAFKEVVSEKHGRDNYKYTERKPSEIVYHIKNFNRKQKVSFKFEVGNISENNFCAIVDNCGVEINIIRIEAKTRPSILSSKVVKKIDIQ